MIHKSVEKNCRLQRWCNQSGFTLQDRDGLRGSLLVSSRRQVCLLQLFDHGSLIGFRSKSRLQLNAEHVPQDILKYMLCSNSRMCFGAWSATEEDGITSFVLQHTALAARMNARAFSTICEEIIKETMIFECLAVRAGLLDRLSIVDGRLME